MSSIIEKFSSSTRRVTFGLSIIQLFKAFLSFFTVIISSAYFGTSLSRDVWLLSMSIVAILGAVLFGPIFEIFRAKFATIKEIEGEKTALRSICSLLLYMLLISVFLIFINEVIPSILSNSFAPTYNNEQHYALSIMIRLIMPTLLFYSIVSILTGVLNVYQIFYVPELMSIVSTLLNVIIILLFAPKFGIYSLVLSTYLSNIILIIVLFFVMKKSKIPLLRYLNLSIHYPLDFFKYALPFYFTYLIAQIILAAEKIISTFLGIGNVSVLDYARKFVTIPISMIQSTINIVLTATLTKIYIKEGEKSFLLELNRFMDLVLLISLPIITLFIICPVEIVRVFLLRGAFDQKFLLPTARALIWFGFGIVSIIFYSTNSQALLAQGKNKVSALISGTMGFLVLIINLLFYKKYGIQVLAFSWSFVHFISGVIMYFILSFKEFSFLFKEFVKKIALLVIVLILSLGVYYFVSSHFMLEQLLVKNLITLTIIGFFAISIEVVLIYLLGFNEKEIIAKFIKSYIYK